jgi:DNA-binding CsgD family transcriptional regulator/ribonuclease BN (tRNA processing enzyme)
VTQPEPTVDPDLPPGARQRLFSPVTATLICGHRDAILVDALLTLDQAHHLADWIAAHGKNLTSVYITHAHGDHWFGLSAILDRYPAARALTLPAAATWTGPGRSTTSCRPGRHGSRPASWRSSCSTCARAAALLGDADGAAIAYARLRPWARYFVVSGTGVVAIDGSAERTLGCLAACLGKPDTAVRHLRAAIAANQRAGLPPSELQSRYELAKVLAQRGRREDRSEALVLAGDTARGAARLGMAPLRADAEQLSKMMRNGDSGPVGLTRREREIAELVGRGLTNRQIADVLHVAERTAENHVQHILTKLGFHNRSQIAAWAARTTPHGAAGR